MEAIAGFGARSDKTMWVMPLPSSFLSSFVSRLLKKILMAQNPPLLTLSSTSAAVRRLNPMGQELLQ